MSSLISAQAESRGMGLLVTRRKYHLRIDGLLFTVQCMGFANIQYSMCAVQFLKLEMVSYNSYRSTPFTMSVCLSR
jgi:hypothetical protein